MDEYKTYSYFLFVLPLKLFHLLLEGFLSFQKHGDFRFIFFDLLSKISAFLGQTTASDLQFGDSLLGFLQLKENKHRD